MLVSQDNVFCGKAKNAQGESALGVAFVAI
jgi:hypothetical protein